MNWYLEWSSSLQDQNIVPGLRLATAAPLRKSPRLCTNHLSLTVCPEIDDHGDQVVEAGVGALVGENGSQGEQGQRGEAGLEAAVDAGAGDEDEGVLPCDHPQAHDQVDDLQYRERLHCRVERLGQEVEEDLGPEEALESGGDLVNASRQGDEPRPVVLDKSAHLDGFFSSFLLLVPFL